MRRDIIAVFIGLMGLLGLGLYQAVAIGEYEQKTTMAHVALSERIAQIEFAYAEAKKGERFTADDGRKLCEVLILNTSAEWGDLPEVCQ